MDVTFKRKKRNKDKKCAGSVKRVRRNDDVDEDTLADETEEILSEVLAEQKVRAQLAKLNRVESSKSAISGTTAAEEAPSVQPSYGLHDPKKDGETKKKLMNLLDGQFTGQTNTSQTDNHEKLM